METTTRTEWTSLYRQARRMNQDVRREASRRALSVMDAARAMGRQCATNRGHVAAWLRIAGELRALRRLSDARRLLSQARKLRTV